MANRFLLLIISSILYFTGHAQDKIELPTVDVSADSVQRAQQFSGTTQRTIDVLHMALEVQLDWPSHTLFGQADIYAKPFFEPVDTFVLDARGFTINGLTRVVGGSHDTLQFVNTGRQLHIAMGKKVQRDEVVQLHIDYSVTPDSLKNEGGSAITNSKGFYFIDSTAHHPQSFWTQGEPESNSAWFPTVDKPYEKITHQIGITVDSTWQTLSNGKIAFRTQNGDGTKTDYWLMDQPHAPYLVMLAGGPFDTASTQWRGRSVNYFVEEKWSDQAKGIFASTPEMLDFFSEKLGVEYPFKSYNQIIVRDYVSGAMENTTAVVYGESVYKDERARADATTENIIAHETIHQWFGDLVTPKTWGDIALNEGFASYGELLWNEHKYGKDELAWYARNEFYGYLRSRNRGNVFPIFRTEFDAPDDMFNAHTYNKAGLVLHMLRSYLGDTAFFASLKNYLQKNQFTAVEPAQLRIAFEETSGQDLRWFFNQWFYQSGHPVINTSSGFKKDEGVATLRVEQVQENGVIYRLPVAVDVYTHLGVKRHFVEVDRAKQTFSFPVHSQPFLIKFDAENVLLAEINAEQSDAMWLHQLGNAKQGIDRYEAAKYLIENSNYRLVQTVERIAMTDDFWPTRLLGMRNAEKWGDGAKGKFKKAMKDLLTDSVPAVRARAIEVWSKVYGEKDKKLYRQNLDFISYRVNAAAMRALAMSEPEEISKMAIAQLENRQRNWALTCAHILADFGEKTQLKSTIETLGKYSTKQQLYFLYFLAENIQNADDRSKMVVDVLAEEVEKSHNKYTEYYAQRYLEEAKATLLENSRTPENPDSNAQKEVADYISKKLEKLAS